MSKMSVLKRVVFAVAVSGVALFSGACSILSWLLPNLLSLAT